MNIIEKLNNVWAQNYINNLPDFVKDRGFVFSENNSKKDILITGFNPSYRGDGEKKADGFNFQMTLREKKWDNYWVPVKKMLYDNENNIDLRDNSAYLDIFYYREKYQNVLKKRILKNSEGICFLVDQLNITQHIIEDIIVPKVIVVKNKESAAYWGKLAEKGIIWMGYQLDFVQTFPSGELFRISGLINSTERIAPEMNNTKLIDSLILFSSHIGRFTKKEKRPTAVLLNNLLKKYSSIE